RDRPKPSEAPEEYRVVPTDGGQARRPSSSPTIIWDSPGEGEGGTMRRPWLGQRPRIAAEWVCFRRQGQRASDLYPTGSAGHPPHKGEGGGRPRALGSSPAGSSDQARLARPVQCT